MKSVLTTLFILFFITFSTIAFAQSFKIDSIIKGSDFDEFSNSSRDYFEGLIDVMSEFTITIDEGDLAIVSMEKSDWKLMFRFYRSANMLKMSQEDYRKTNEFYCTSDIINEINYIEMSVERISQEISSGEMSFYPEKGLYKSIFTVKFSLKNELYRLRQIELARQRKATGEEHLYKEKKEMQTTQYDNHKMNTSNIEKKNQDSGLVFGIAYHLAGRSSLSLPKPKYPGYNEGIVVVKITVDKLGKVTNAEPGARGTNLMDEKYWEAVKEAAYKAKFNTDEAAPAFQIGTIAYTIY